MKCKVAWNTEFLVNKLGKNFVYQQYKVHREDVLLERERARLPEALEIIQVELDKTKKQEELRNFFLKEAAALKQEAEAIPNLPSLRQTTSKVLKAQAQQIDESTGLTKEMKTEADRAHAEYYGLIETLPEQQNYPNYLLYAQADAEWDGRRSFLSEEEKQWGNYVKRAVGLICRLDPKEDLLTQFRQRVEHAANKVGLEQKAKSYLRHAERVLKINLDTLSTGAAKPRFIRACPAEGCRGLLTEDWFCPMCRKLTCSKCQEIKGEEHKCLPESVETAKLLKHDTKPCPGCASMIFKIEGCDQMFCTQCGTAFSWRTGMKETGVIHNPHFYEYQRRRTEAQIQAQAQQQNACEGYDDNASAIADMYISMNEKDIRYPLIEELRTIDRSYHHNRQVALPHYNIEPPVNLDLRLKFLKKEVDETKLKDLLQRRDKDYNKRKDYHGVLSTYLAAQSDILKRADEMIKSHSKSGKNPLTVDMITPFITEFSNLREEFNLWLLKTGEYYNCLAPHIHSNYQIYRSANQAPKERSNLDSDSDE